MARELKQRPPTQRELATTRRTLRRFEQGNVPEDIFFEFVRLFPMAFVELAVFSENPSRPEVLLTPRSADDRFWPGAWHIPGVAIRPQDKSFQGTLNRLTETELEGLEISAPVFSEVYFRDGDRGIEIPVVYLAKAIGKPAVGEFFDVGKLPVNMVDVHRPLVQRSAEAIKKA